MIKEMTSYQVIAPVFLGRFQHEDGVVFHAWSPRRYGPAYTYDIVLEGEDNQHPCMNPEYIATLQRVFQKIEGEEGEEEVGDQRETFVDLTTDDHCPVALEERGEAVYFVTLRDSPFSPVFFLEGDARIYLEHLCIMFPAQRSRLRIREADHSFV